MVVVARIFKGIDEKLLVLHSVGHFDLSDSQIYGTVREDYEYVRKKYRKKDFLMPLTGKMGTHIQP